MSKWLKPLKVREYYLDSHFDSIKAADKWLYLAVVRGVVRARSRTAIKNEIRPRQPVFPTGRH